MNYHTDNFWAKKDCIDIEFNEFFYDNYIPPELIVSEPNIPNLTKKNDDTQKFINEISKLHNIINNLSETLRKIIK